MKTTSTFAALAALFAASAAIPVRRDVPTDLIPEFGVQSGVNPDGTGYVLAVRYEKHALTEWSTATAMALSSTASLR